MVSRADAGFHLWMGAVAGFVVGDLLGGGLYSFAAAPDLLRACESAKKEFEALQLLQGAGVVNSVADLEHILSELRAAIARATGA